MDDARLPLALIVAGPTASGKSALAIALAERLGGTIVNADSMQTYRELRVLTARPTPEEEARVPHVLYGTRAAADVGTAASWRAEALAAMDAARAAGRLPILAGGTGMYVDALVNGIAEIPPVDEAARGEARRLLAELGAPALHAGLAKVDPATAHRLNPNDAQRVARAWEVWRTTGQGLAAWQGRRGPPAPWRFVQIALDPPGEALRAAIEARFGAMLDQGALDEVRALLGLGLDPALPLMRAHGVPELAGYLGGEWTLAEARRRAVLATGQYTKRQATWLRHRGLADPSRARSFDARWPPSTQYSERILDELVQFVRERG